MAAVTDIIPSSIADLVAPAPAHPNSIYLNIGGDIYTRRGQFLKNYEVTESEATTLMDLFDSRTGLLRTNVELTKIQKDLVKKALEKRIKNINRQFNQSNKNALIYQRLRQIEHTLQSIVDGLDPLPTAPPAPEKKPKNEATRKRLDDKLMSLLLRIGYAVTHAEQIPDEFIVQWNAFLKATDDLTKTRIPQLDINSTAINETKSYTIDKASLTPSTPYKNVTGYLNAITSIGNKENEFKSQIGATLSALYTYQFIKETEKKAFENKNTEKLRTMTPEIIKRLQVRFSNSMTLILQYYQDVFGPVLYKTINTPRFLDKMRPLPTPKKGTAFLSIQDSLGMIESILQKVYKKLYSPDTTVSRNAYGIYKFNKDTSAKLIPFINYYTEQVKGQSLPDDTMKEKLGTKPFVWFQLGSTVVNQPIKLAPETFGKLNQKSKESLAETFYNFIGNADEKDMTVFMMVFNKIPDPTVTNPYIALLHLYEVEPGKPNPTIEWNKQLTAAIPFDALDKTLLTATTSIGPRLNDIGIGVAQWPLYTIQTHLSLPMLQCMTFLAVVNQSSEKSKRYR